MSLSVLSPLLSASPLAPPIQGRQAAWCQSAESAPGATPGRSDNTGPEAQGQFPSQRQTPRRRPRQGSWSGTTGKSREATGESRDHKVPTAGVASHKDSRRAGTRGSQAAASFSVLAVFLLLKLRHQAELAAAAAFGKLQHHILWGRRETGESEPGAARPGPRQSKRQGRGGARSLLYLLWCPLGF